MKKRFYSMALCLTFLLSAALPLSGCGAPGSSSVRLTENLSARTSGEDAPLAGETRDGAVSFAVRLFQGAGGRALVSPLSALSALAMTANGARGETLDQMEAVLGGETDALNACLRALAAELPSEKDCTVSLANSVWLRDDPGLTVEPAFLEAAAGYYGADVYKAPFDGATLADVNAWVDRKTGGMIEQILDQIPEEAMLCLVNALSFDGKWETVYREDQVGRGDFTAESGAVQTGEFLYSTEALYLEDPSATGFLKPYAGGRYAFAALLPREGVTLADYVASLTGPGLLETLEAARAETVRAAIPKFQSSASLELSGMLKAMGMEDAFSVDTADFSGMGTYEDRPLLISRVLHETRFDLDEQGTRAGAATAVEIRAGSAAPVDEKIVRLDRPFVYLLIDTETCLPLFLGALTEL